MICIQPVGDVERDILEFIRQSMATLFGEARIIRRMDLRQEFYDTGRKQYRADKILDALDTSCPITLGITREDIYTPSMNFVFGLAEIDGRRVLVSTKRLSPEFYSMSPDRKLFRIRILKEVMHELGHALGLAHCPDPVCVMHFSNSIIDTDRKNWSYCPACSTKLKLKGQIFRIQRFP